MNGVYSVLVVEDFEPIRQHICVLLKESAEFQVIGEASDGAEAVQQAEKLNPHLILLDIGLPKLNGLEVARQVLKLGLRSKIVFVSQESDPGVIEAALNLGTSGYVVKANANRDLLSAMRAVLKGQQFASNGHAAPDHAEEVSRFRFEIDRENRVVRGMIYGPMTSALLKEYYATAASLVGDADFRGSITDFSGVTSIDVTLDGIRELAALPPIDPVAARPRVIVAPNVIAYGLARLFQAFGLISRPNLHVVRRSQQALDLLSVVNPHFQAAKQPGLFR